MVPPPAIAANGKSPVSFGTHMALWRSYTRILPSRTAIRIQPLVIDREGARADLRIADKYIEEFFDAWGKHAKAAFYSPPRGIAAEIVPIIDKIPFRNLAHAKKHVASAEAKDPNANIIVNIDGEVVRLSLGEVKSRVLFGEALVETLPGPNDDLYRSGVSLFKQSLELAPFPKKYAILIEEHFKHFNDKGAIEIVNERLTKFPDDFGLRKRKGELKDNKGFAAHKIRRISKAAFAVGIVFVLISIATLIFGSYNNTAVLLIPIGFFLIGVGLILFDQCCQTTLFRA